MTVPQRDEFRFLDLPPEIRNAVYEMAVGTKTRHVKRTYLWRKRIQCGYSAPELAQDIHDLMVNKQVFDEGVAVLYKTSVFVFRGPLDFASFVSCVPRSKLISSFRIEARTSAGMEIVARMSLSLPKLRTAHIHLGPSSLKGLYTQLFNTDDLKSNTLLQLLATKAYTSFAFSPSALFNGCIGISKRNLKTNLAAIQAFVDRAQSMGGVQRIEAFGVEIARIEEDSLGLSEEGEGRDGSSGGVSTRQAGCLGIEELEALLDLDEVLDMPF